MIIKEYDTNVKLAKGYSQENTTIPLLNPGAHNGNVIAYDAAPLSYSSTALA